MAAKKEEKKEVGIKVRAERPCYYGDVYRPEGCEFTVKTENEISLGMERMDGKPHPSEKKRNKTEEKPDSNVKPLKTPETIKEAGNQLI